MNCSARALIRTSHIMMSIDRNKRYVSMQYLSAFVQEVLGRTWPLGELRHIYIT